MRALVHRMRLGSRIAAMACGLGLCAAGLTAFASAPEALVFDAETKEVRPNDGETSIKFTFAVTNVSSSLVVITNVQTSCGCTLVSLPDNPWRLDPGKGGEFAVAMEVAGKYGLLSKGVLVLSTAGAKSLTVKALLPDAAPAATGMGQRAMNIRTALADRQAVFKNDCAKCHVEPAIGKLGEPLYQAACAICHDGPHRASIVPDLRNLAHPTNPDYWRQWTMHGKPGSLMPAFAQSEGGPLTDEQIKSLVEYLSKAIPSKVSPANSVFE